MSVTTTATSTPRPRAQLGAQAGGAGVGVGGEQGELVGRDVGAVDARGGLHDAELARDDQRAAAAGDHPLGLGVDELAAQPVALLRVGRGGHEAALDLGDHLGGDDDDVAVGQPGRGGGERAGEVVAGPELGQARHRQDGEAPGRRGRRRGPDRTACGAPAAPASSSDRPGPAQTPATSSAARAIAAVAGTSVISSGTARTSTPGTSAASPVCTSQPSSSPPSARAP